MPCLLSVSFLLLVVPHMVAGSRVRTGQEGRQALGLADPTCLTIEQVIYKQVPDDVANLLEPVAEKLPKCKTGNVGRVTGLWNRWDGSRLTEVLTEHRVVEGFAREGLALILVSRARRLHPPQFEVCYWHGVDTQPPEAIESITYHLSDTVAGSEVVIGCAGQKKTMPDGVAAQSASKPRGCSYCDPHDIAILFDFRIRYEIGDMPVAVWKLLSSKRALALHERFAIEFNGRKTYGDAQDIVDEYKMKFLSKGIGLFFTYHHTRCNDQDIASRLVGHEEHHYHFWFQYADLGVVDESYAPGSD